MISVVVPVYRNEECLPDLLKALEGLNTRFDGDFEVVFVVDGSPDGSFLFLDQSLAAAGFAAQLLSLSRNFGAFSAIRAGMAAARGDVVAVMAADLQEPPELIERFHEKLASGDFDVAIGRREGRDDPGVSKAAASLYWRLYRRFVLPEIPPGGVDVFACTRRVCDQLLQLQESNSSLVGLLFWVGYRRAFVPYERRARAHGRSAWSFAKKRRYLSDSVFGFTDLPLRILQYVGLLGLAASLVFALLIVAMKVTGAIPIPGYAATVLVVTFFGALNLLGIGIIGGYMWRTFENTKGRPSSIVVHHAVYGAKAPPAVGPDTRSSREPQDLPAPLTRRSSTGPARSPVSDPE